MHVHLCPRSAEMGSSHTVCAEVQLAPEVCPLWIVCWSGYQQHLSVDLEALAFVQSLQRFSESSVIVMPQRLCPWPSCPFSCLSPHKAPNPRLRTRRKWGLAQKHGLCWFSPDWLVIPCAVPDRKHKSCPALSLQGAKKKKKKEPGVSTGVEKSVHVFGE